MVLEKLSWELISYDLLIAQNELVLFTGSSIQDPLFHSHTRQLIEHGQFTVLGYQPKFSFFKQHLSILICFIKPNDLQNVQKIIRHYFQGTTYMYMNVIRIKEKLTRVIISLARSLARSGVTKQARPVRDTPASYMFWLLKS